VDILLSIRPHIQARLKPYFEQENAILASVLEQGNRQGLLDVPNTMRAARSLKLMVKGFFPPYPCINNADEVREEVGNMVDLAVRGMLAQKLQECNIIK
jgi:hypothetical protein